MKNFRFGMMQIGAVLLAALSLASMNAATAQSSNESESQSSASSSGTSLDVQVDAASSDAAADAAVERTPRHERWERWDHWGDAGRGDELVTMRGDSHLAAGEQAGTVVSIMGSSTSDGDVRRDVVSIMGNTRVTGPIGGSAVAVMGNTYVNSSVQDDVVAVLGDVELGPQADVQGDVVAVGGSVIRDPAAMVRGDVRRVGMGWKSNSFAWLRPWIDQCLMYARPLAIGPGLTWAWVIAMVSLLSYVFTAWLAPRPVERCVLTLEQHAGASLLSALAGMVLSPVLMILLVITVIGILAVPFVGLALLAIGMFGKLVLLAWLGRRVTRAASDTVMGHMAVVTLIGGVIVTVLYLVPVLGFIVYKLLGFIGFGVVLYTLLLAFQQRPRAPASQSGATINAAPEAVYTAPVNEADTGNTETAAGVAEPVATTALPRATFWIRMAALLIDALLITFVLGVLDIDHITLLVLAVYGALMWKYKGTTIGGLVFHLQVVRVDGRALDWSTVIVRALSCFLSLLPAGLGFIWIAIDDGRQAWHDKIAGTVVVRTPKSGSLV